jgi:hypothetical protein
MEVDHDRSAGYLCVAVRHTHWNHLLEAKIIGKVVRKILE